MFSDNKTKSDHEDRINKVFEFIEANLDSKLSLELVAEVAYFSPYHFHRVFKTITGETLNEYITRRRMEKTASELIHTDTEITHISHKYGFSDVSSLSRTFKKHFGVSPTEFKKQHPHKFSKIRQLESKNGQAYPDRDKYICVINNLKQWTKMNANIEIKNLPKMELAYVNCIGINGIGESFEKLMKWAIPNGLLDANTKTATIYHDSFQVTAPDKVRMSACVVLDKPVEVQAPVALSTIEESKCVVGRFEITQEEFEKAWTSQFIWMNENGYTRSEINPFEIYHNNYMEHPEKKFIVDICIPVN